MKLLYKIWIGCSVALVRVGAVRVLQLLHGEPEDGAEAGELLELLATHVHRRKDLGSAAELADLFEKRCETCVIRSKMI